MLAGWCITSRVDFSGIMHLQGSVLVSLKKKSLVAAGGRLWQKQRKISPHIHM